MILGQFDQILTIIQKIFGVTGSLLYLIFAFIVVRQVSSMSKIVHDKFNSILLIFSYLHLIAAFLLFLLAVFTL